MADNEAVAAATIDADDAAFFAEISAAWTPPKTQSLSEWCEEHFILSSEYSPRTGPLVLFQFQREVLDSFTDSDVREIVIMCSTQLLKTLFIQCVIAYVAAEDPGPMLLLLPKEDAARKFSRTRLGPMIRDIPKLSAKISSSLHDGTATMLTKEFPGGSLIVATASTAIDVAAQTVRIVMSDEIDKYQTLKNEGDPNYLAWKRAANYGSRKKRIQTCSPTSKYTSRIGQAYRGSDMRKPWVACPTCGTWQVLKFFTATADDGTVSNAHSSRSTGGVWFDSSLPHDQSPATARYLCVNKDCAASKPAGGWTDVQRTVACESLEWRADAPFTGIAGFWISKLYSPWESMSDLVTNFLSVKDNREQYRSFMNTDLAEEWEERGETPDHELLYERRETYPFGVSAIIPQRACFLTCAVDVQQSPPRLEYHVVAWGRHDENWSVDYGVIQAYPLDASGLEDPTQPPLPVDNAAVWQKFDLTVLQRDFLHESGHLLPIYVCCIDTGNMADPVYKFARRKLQLAYSPTDMRVIGPRTVVPIKGDANADKILSRSPQKENPTAGPRSQGVRIVMVGTHFGKQKLFSSLMHYRPVVDGSLSGAPAPNCHHFPMFDKDYFLGVTAETLVIDKDGKKHYEKRYPRNEPVDGFVYNYAAAELCGMSRFQEAHWQAMEAKLKPIHVQGERTSPDSISLVDLEASPSPPAKPGAQAAVTASTPGTPPGTPPRTVTPTAQPPAQPASQPAARPLFRPVSLPVRGRF
jgi:phage terminase large subunit GpA-like protein